MEEEEVLYSERDFATSKTVSWCQSRGQQVCTCRRSINTKGDSISPSSSSSSWEATPFQRLSSPSLHKSSRTESLHLHHNRKQKKSPWSIYLSMTSNHEKNKWEEWRGGGNLICLMNTREKPLLPPKMLSLSLCPVILLLLLLLLIRVSFPCLSWEEEATQAWRKLNVCYCKQMMMMLLFLLQKLGKGLSKEAKGRMEVTEARKERE